MNPLILLVALLAFILIAGVGLVVASTSGANQRIAKRTQAIATRTNRADKSARMATRQAQVDPQQRRKQIVRSLKDDERRQRKAAFSIEGRLRQAGLSTSLQVYWICAGVLGVVMMGVAFVFHASLLISLLIGFVGAIGVPLWLIGALAKRRKAKFVAVFADGVDIIVRGVRSGLPLHDCLKVVGKESPEPLGGEFRHLVESLSMGVQLDQALDKAYERMPTPEMRFFTIVLTIQQKAGGNLGEALGNLSAVVRGRRMMREKIKALSGEAIASAWIIGLLPVAVMVLIQISSPGYLNVMFTDKRGHAMLMGAGLLMLVGVLVMRKMINFKI